MSTIHERVEAMSNDELWAHMENEQPAPAVLEAIKRFRVETESPAPSCSTPYKPSCCFCGGSGTVGLGTKCTHCQGEK